MGKPPFGGEFKLHAVAPIVARGDPVAVVSQRFGTSQHSSRSIISAGPLVLARGQIRDRGNHRRVAMAILTAFWAT